MCLMLKCACLKPFCYSVVVCVNGSTARHSKIEIVERVECAVFDYFGGSETSNDLIHSWELISVRLALCAQCVTLCTSHVIQFSSLLASYR